MKKINNLNEQLNRMKQLMGENRLYGNLVETSSTTIILKEQRIFKILDELIPSLKKANITDDVIKKFESVRPSNFDDMLKHMDDYADVWRLLLKNTKEPYDQVKTVLKKMKDGKIGYFDKIADTDIHVYELLPDGFNFRFNASSSYRKKVGDTKFFDELNSVDKKKLGALEKDFGLVDDVEDAVYEVIEDIKDYKGKKVVPVDDLDKYMDDYLKNCIKETDKGNVVIIQGNNNTAIFGDAPQVKASIEEEVEKRMREKMGEENFDKKMKDPKFKSWWNNFKSWYGSHWSRWIINPLTLAERGDGGKLLKKELNWLPQSRAKVIALRTFVITPGTFTIISSIINKICKSRASFTGCETLSNITWPPYWVGGAINLVLWLGLGDMVASNAMDKHCEDLEKESNGKVDCDDLIGSFEKEIITNHLTREKFPCKNEDGTTPEWLSKDTSDLTDGVINSVSDHYVDIDFEIPILSTILPSANDMVVKKIKTIIKDNWLNPSTKEYRNLRSKISVKIDELKESCKEQQVINDSSVQATESAKEEGYEIIDTEIEVTGGVSNQGNQGNQGNQNSNGGTFNPEEGDF